MTFHNLVKRKLYLIVIYVIMNLKLLLQMFLKVRGVHIVLIINYVMMKNVIYVLINHLHHMKNLNIGVIKMNFHQEMFLNLVKKILYLIVMIVIMNLRLNHQIL